MRGFKMVVGVVAAGLLVLKLTGGVAGFGSGDRIDATAVTLLVVIAVAPMLDRIIRVGTEGIELQPAAELDDVKRQLDRVADQDPSGASPPASAQPADAEAVAQDPLAVVVAARTLLADTLRRQVRHQGAGLVGPSIADNARRLADRGVITDDLQRAVDDLGIRLDTARRPSAQYAADIADLVHTAVGSINQQVEQRRAG